MIALYLFGGEVLKGFAFTMLVGIISGTYSTVFIAASIAIVWQGRKPLKGQAGGAAPAPATRPSRRRGAPDARPVVAALREPCRPPSCSASIQGLTEFLPVSSSAHLILARVFFGWEVPPAFGLAFDVALHIGTLAAIVVFFRAEIIAMVAVAAVGAVRRRRALGARWRA